MADMCRAAIARGLPEIGFTEHYDLHPDEPNRDWFRLEPWLVELERCRAEFAGLLTNSVCVPAAGQGALAVLIRSSEEQFRDTVQSINDPSTHAMLRAEWSFLEHLGVDPSPPVAVLAPARAPPMRP